ncbi:glycosyltransferase family 4 protein [Chloroflexota bacterium]
MKPISVLQSITRLIVGGAQEHVMYIAALLDKNRYQVDILSGPQTGMEGSLIEEVRARDIPLIIVPELVRQISPWKDFCAMTKMKRAMRNNHYVIVHTNSSKAGILGRFAARMAGVPIIIHTVHGWSFHDEMSSLTRSCYILLERQAAKFSNAIITVSNLDIEKGLSAGIGSRQQYHLIRSAIPLDEFNPSKFDRDAIRQELGIPKDTVVVGNIGRFSHPKNPMDWLQIAVEISRAADNVHFLLVGDGPLRYEFENLLKSEGLWERTTLTGLRRDVPRMLSVMDIFIFTSSREGLPRTIPQAMAMGIPVIANRVGGIPEVIQEGVTGYLCQPGDIYKPAEICIYLINHPIKREKVGRKGRAIAENEFSVDVMIKQTSNLYEELISKKI